MTVYVLAEIQVTDDSWIPEYAANVHDIVHKHGGKYLARSANIKTIEGDPSGANIIAIMEFPSMEAAEAFSSDPDYAPYRESRGAGSVSRFQAIDSTDAAGTIPYLAKGE